MKVSTRKNCMDEIFPSYIKNVDFRFIELDQKYIASLIISGYPKNLCFLNFFEALPKDLRYDISIFIQKRNTMEVLKELTYNISSSGAEISTIHDNQIDIDLLKRSKDEAKELRREIQLNNEEVFSIAFFITFYSNQKESLVKILKDFKTRLFSRQIFSVVSNFRHLDVYLLNLPIFDFQSYLIKSNSLYLTRSYLSNLLPFYTKNLFQKNGIILGYTKINNSMFNIDFFHKDYFNANISIFGSSGSGKSYFAKLMIFRQNMLGRVQYIFDPEGEYLPFIQRVNGVCVLFRSDTPNFFNIMQIYEFEMKEYREKVFYFKVEEVVAFLSKFLDDYEENIDEVLKSAVIKAYVKKGINENLSSMYKIKDEKKIYVDSVLKESCDFPVLTDILSNIENLELRKKISDIIQTHLYTLSNDTTFDVNHALILFEIPHSIKNASVFVQYFLDKILLILKYQKRQSIIYVDEMWQYITTDQFNIANTFFMLFKTIRKRNASIVTITQDITDFLTYQDGLYGKSLLNNSSFKFFFKLEYLNISLLEELGILGKIEYKDLLSLDKGETFMMFKKNSVLLHIKASNFEKKIIEGENDEDISRIR